MSNITNTPIVQDLIINFIGIDQFTSLTPLFKLINEFGGNVIKCRVSQFGNMFSGSILVDGPWNTIARIEESIDDLKTKLKLQIIHQRTTSADYNELDKLENQVSEITNNNSSKEINNIEPREYIPYKISINNIDESGLIEKITAFFILQEIHIQDLYTNSYTAEYGSELVQIDIKIKIPSDIHIPSLKEQFDILCYNENLDASLMPYKI